MFTSAAGCKLLPLRPAVDMERKIFLWSKFLKLFVDSRKIVFLYCYGLFKILLWCVSSGLFLGRNIALKSLHNSELPALIVQLTVCVGVFECPITPGYCSQ